MAPKQALICGSMAFDTIMVFEDRFKNHILADKVHMLSVAFYVPTLRREFGGCAGNISYNLKLLGGHPVPFGAVGRDFGADGGGGGHAGARVAGSLHGSGVHHHRSR